MSSTGSSASGPGAPLLSPTPAEVEAKKKADAEAKKKAKQLAEA